METAREWRRLNPVLASDTNETASVQKDIFTIH